MARARTTFHPIDWLVDSNGDDLETFPDGQYHHEWPGQKERGRLARAKQLIPLIAFLRREAEAYLRHAAQHSAEARLVCEPLVAFLHAQPSQGFFAMYANDMIRNPGAEWSPIESRELVIWLMVLEALAFRLTPVRGSADPPLVDLSHLVPPLDPERDDLVENGMWYPVQLNAYLPTGRFRQEEGGKEVPALFSLVAHNKAYEDGEIYVYRLPGFVVPDFGLHGALEVHRPRKMPNEVGVTKSEPDTVDRIPLDYPREQSVWPFVEQRWHAVEAVLAHPGASLEEQVAHAEAAARR